MELHLHSPNVFMAWCLVKHRDNFTFLLSEATITQGKDRVVPVIKHHAIKTYWGSGGIASCTLKSVLSVLDEGD